jgi:hypothetical protein
MGAPPPPLPQNPPAAVTTIVVALMTVRPDTFTHALMTSGPGKSRLPVQNVGAEIVVVTGDGQALALALGLALALVLALGLDPPLTDGDGDALREGEALADCDDEQAKPGQPHITTGAPRARRGAPVPSVCALSTVSETRAPPVLFTIKLPLAEMLSAASVALAASSSDEFHAREAPPRPGTSSVAARVPQSTYTVPAAAAATEPPACAGELKVPPHPPPASMPSCHAPAPKLCAAQRRLMRPPPPPPPGV